LVAVRDETKTARTLTLDVPDWPGHLAGQHVDLRLTAADGYRAQRSYSIASADGGDQIELTVQRLPDGEVSPYLTTGFQVGNPIELRGPVGGWFVWRPGDTAPVLLIAGGSGIVPLMAMIRARAAAGRRVPFRLVYSVRTADDVYYADELRQRQRDDGGLDVYIRRTRTADGGRLTPLDLVARGWPAEFEPDCFICGPTGFVETMADALIELGHDAARVKTERFG
jgi:ferredoxin-NADP reductase